MEQRIKNAIEFFEQNIPHPSTSNETAYVLSDGLTHIAFDDEPCHGALKGVVGTYMCKTCATYAFPRVSSYRYIKCEHNKETCGFNGSSVRKDFMPLFVATHKLERETTATEAFAEYITERSPVKDFYYPSPDDEYYITRCDMAGNEMLFALQLMRTAYGEGLTNIAERFGDFLLEGIIPEGKEWTALLLNLMYDNGSLPSNYTSGVSDYMVLRTPSLSRESARRFLELDFITDQEKWSDVWVMGHDERRRRKTVTTGSSVNNGNSNPIKGVWALFHKENAAPTFVTKAMKKQPEYDYYREFLPQRLNSRNFLSTLDSFEAFLKGDI